MIVLVIVTVAQLIALWLIWREVRKVRDLLKPAAATSLGLKSSKAQPKG